MKKHILFDYVYHGIYLTIYGLFKYIPSPIGDFFRKIIFKILLKKCAKARIYEGVTIWYPYRVKIGKNVTVNEFVYISGYGGVCIGNNVSIGHRTSIISSDHVIADKNKTIKQQGIVGKMTVIGNDVFIGCNVTILMGVSIGEGSVIGAGSVVTKDIPPYTVFAGNPAKEIKKR